MIIKGLDWNLGGTKWNLLCFHQLADLLPVSTFSSNRFHEVPGRVEPPNPSGYNICSRFCPQVPVFVHSEGEGLDKREDYVYNKYIWQRNA